VRNKDVVKTLLESLSTSYKHLIITFMTMSMKELITKYMFKHEIPKKKEKESQGNNVASRKMEQVIFT